MNSPIAPKKTENFPPKAKIKKVKKQQKSYKVKFISLDEQPRKNLADTTPNQ